MKHSLRTIMSALIGALALLVLAGCQPGTVTSEHQKEVKAANQRWHEIRSRLLLQMAQRQFDTGDLDQADKSLGDALAVDDQNPRLFLLAGRVAVERGELEKAYKLLTHAIDLDPSFPEPYYYRGLVLQRWQRYDQALADYQKAYQFKSQDPAYLLAVAETLATLNRTDEALKLLQEKLSYFDQNAGVRLAMAQLYMIKRQYPQAAEAFRQASLLKPDDQHIIENMAIVQYEAGQYNQCIQNLEDLTARPENSKRWDLQKLLGAAYEAVGRLPAARGIYIAITQADPGDAGAWLKLAAVSWAMHDASGTEVAAGRCIALDPRRPDAYVLAALAQEKQNNLPAALHNLDKAAELAPTDAGPVILRGLALQGAGRRTEAAQAYTEALRRDPKDVQAQKLLAALGPEAGRS